MRAQNTLKGIIIWYGRRYKRDCSSSAYFIWSSAVRFTHKVSWEDM